MIAKTTSDTLAGRFPTPEEAGTTAHARRVAAWCEELASSLNLSAEESVTLREAALMHHHPAELVQGRSFTRLIEDLGIPAGKAPEHHSGLFSPQAEQVLAHFHKQSRSSGNIRAAQLAYILETANLFDEQLEYAPFEQDSIDTVLNHAMEDGVRSGKAVNFVLKHLRKGSRADLTAVTPKLPVYPAVAMQLYRLLSQNEISLNTLETVAKADQVIAGKLVKAANSVYYGPRQPIKSVSQAVNYIGSEDARRLLLASAIQPLFESPRLRKLWTHAIEAAQVSEKLATLTQDVDPAEAFLMGLLHDVGKLAMALMSRQLNSSLDRLLKAGCEPALAELVLCGFDHAEAGAEILTCWNFSQELITAIQYHHQPERTNSKMAAILYLTEFWTDAQEDLPSTARLNIAVRKAGIPREALENARLELNGALASL